MSAALLRLVGVMCAAVVAGSAELLREDATGTSARGGVIVGVGILSRSDHVAQRRCVLCRVYVYGHTSSREHECRTQTQAHTRTYRGLQMYCTTNLHTRTHTHTHRCFTNLHAHTHTAARSLSQPPSPLSSSPSHLLRRGKRRRGGQRYIWTDATSNVFVRNRDRRACVRANTKCRASG